MGTMEYIEDYFKGQHTDEQKQQFEQRIINDVSFAEEVAFYISANAIVKEQLQKQKKQRFREIYDQQKVLAVTKQPVTRVWQYLAAASVVSLVTFLSWFLFSKSNTSEQLADSYINQNLTTMDISMGEDITKIQDSLQTGLALFNEGKLTEALTAFETIIKKDTANSPAKKYAGIVCLRLARYGEALKYFSLLESDTSLYSNPGKWYKAVTLLKRNESGDADEAERLLQQIIEKDVEGKQEAEQWLKQLR